MREGEWKTMREGERGREEGAPINVVRQCNRQKSYFETATADSAGER